MAITPYPHQLRGRDTLLDHPRFYLAWDMGTAKTCTVLMACEARPMRTLVLCPKSVRHAAWGGDSQHFPSIHLQVIEGSKASRLRRIAAPWDVAVTNYETFRTDAAAYLNAGVRRLVCDEASRCKSFDSATTEAVHGFSHAVDSCWMLSGTPDPNGCHEFVPQLRSMSREVFGWDTYWGVMVKYFYQIKKQRRDGREYPIWKQTPEQAAAFQAVIKPWVWSLKKSECLSLPPQSDMIFHVELTDAEAEAHRQAEEELRIRYGGKDVTVHPNAATMKCRQILGGGVIIEGVETQIGASKLNVLAEVLDNIGDQPVVIWAEFRREIRAIESMIRKRGETVARIDGETSGNAGDTVKAFQSGSIKRLVCHPASAGHGITLTAASYAIYYSMSFSAEQHAQSRDRIYRMGQTLPCTFVYLLVPETVDTAMFGVVRHKKKMSDAMAAVLGRKADTVEVATI